MSGGCVEGAVYELAQEVIASGRAVVQRYGVSDDDAFAVGLTCGGILDILVEPVSPATFPLFGEVVDLDRAARAGRDRHRHRGPRRGRRHGGSCGRTASPARSAWTGWMRRVDDDARGMLAQGTTGVRRYGRHGERRLDELAVFVHSFAPPPRMLVFGAIDFAAAVARVGKFLGYHVTVCDARPVFATAKRFPEADEVIARSGRTGSSPRHRRTWTSAR